MYQDAALIEGVVLDLVRRVHPRIPVVALGGPLSLTASPRIPRMLR